MNLEEIHSHLFDREYMSGIERERTRVHLTAECFTPTWLVEQRLDTIDSSEFVNPIKTFIDPSCGDGQFLASVLYRKLQNDIDFETALRTIYGVDLMLDNVEETRTRLLCGREDLRHVVDRNIVCHDGLTYDYSFNGTKKNNDEMTFGTLFD